MNRNAAKTLKLARKATGMTQAQAAIAARVSLRQYKRWEAGESMPGKRK